LTALLLALLFIPGPLPAPQKCPPYWLFAGWDRGSDVQFDISGVGGYRNAAMRAFDEWNVANVDTGNGSEVIFEPATGPPEIVVKIGHVPDRDGVRVAGITNATGFAGGRVVRATITIDVDKFGDLGKEQFFTKILMHELGHTMGLGDVASQSCGDSAGHSIMNQLCDISHNDSEGMLPDNALQPCDVNAIKNDPRWPKKSKEKKPDNCRPCFPGGPICTYRPVCTKVDPGPGEPPLPLDCNQELVCQRPGKDLFGTCCGDRSDSLSQSEPCGSWLEINPLPGGFGDYACLDPDAELELPTCAELGLLSERTCAQGVEVTIPDLGVRCYRCPGTTPPPDTGREPGCVPQSCGYSTGQQCRWLADGCGGTHLCGTCGPSCMPGYDAAGNAIIECSDGSGGPSCDGAHNEVCYPSFKACSEECCGVCERRIGCGGESAHKCFEP